MGELRPLLQRPRAAPTDEERRHEEACRAGDPVALDRFFRQHVHTVERVLARLVGPTPELEDLVQNTFIEAIRSFPAYRGEASIGSWVTRIAVHTAYRHLRRGVRRFVALEALPEADEALPSEPPAERALDARRTTVRLHAALDRIKPKKRIAFLLYVVEGHSVEEIAALTGSSRTAVKSQLFFARRELQGLVKADPVLRAEAELLLNREGAQ